MSTDDISNAATAFIAQSASCTRKLVCAQPYTKKLDDELAALQTTVETLRAHIKKTSREQCLRPTYAQVMAMNAVVHDLLQGLDASVPENALYRPRVRRRLRHWWHATPRAAWPKQSFYDTLLSVTAEGLGQPDPASGPGEVDVRDYLDSTIKLHFKAAGVCPYSIPYIHVNAPDAD